MHPRRRVCSGRLGAEGGDKGRGDRGMGTRGRRMNGRAAGHPGSENPEKYVIVFIDSHHKEPNERTE